MKTPKLLLLLVVLTVGIFATAFSAHAQVQASATSLMFGGKDQLASNPLHDDEDKRDVNVTVTVTLTNNGAAPVTVDSASFTGAVTETRFGRQVNALPVTIQPATTQSLTITLRIPENLDAIGTDLKPIIHNIGTVNFKQGTTNLLATAIDLKMQRENELEFKKVRVDVDGKQTTLENDPSQGKDEVKDIKRGDELTITVEAESNYRDKDDTDIESVEIDVESLDSDLDIDESEDLNDLSPDDTDEISVDYAIEKDVDDGSYDVQFRLQGTDEHGARHGAILTHEFKVEVESDEITIQEMLFSPAQSLCSDETVSLIVNIENTGRDNQRRPSVKVEAPRLNFQKRVYDDTIGELDEGDETSVTFAVPIPDRSDKGKESIPFQVTSYYDRATESDSESLLLDLPDCTGAMTEEPITPPVSTPGGQTQEPPIVIQPPVVVPPVVQPPVVTPNDGDDQPVVTGEFTSGTGYLVLLGVGILVLCIVAAVLIAKMVPRDK